MPLTKKILLSIVLAVLIGHRNLQAMEEKKNEDFPVRRKIEYPLLKQEYQEYLDLKNKSLPFLENLKTRILPLYELRKEGRLQILLLGTHHELPVDILYPCFWNYFQKAEEIYVEDSRFDWFSNLSQAQSELNLYEEALKKYENSPLQSFLKIFNKDVGIRNLTLKQLFYFVYAAPYFFGIDTGLMFQALHEKKPIYMLDKESDLNSSCTLMIKSEEEIDEANKNNTKEKSIIDEEEYIKNFLNSTKGFEKIEFVENNIQESLDYFLDYYLEKDKNLELDSKNKILEEDDPLDILEVKNRNERWFNILASNTEKTKLVAVGFYHLQGLLPLFNEAGYTAEKIQMDSNSK
ncbi:MAG: hypothetical protein KBD90_06140 [Alphaproteobacteria bacterium]|nr:hypothetical protein [Alphaproteobacteria bacterium]